MAVKVEGRRIIRAPVQKVFQLVSRLETAPRVTGLWLTADLVERRANSLTVHYRGYFAGMPVESTQRAILHSPHRIEFRQSRGNLKLFRGQYQFKPIEGDTEVSLTLEAEPGIPLLSEQAAALVLHSFIERSLEKFKLTAERDLPRVVRKAVEDGRKEAPPVAEAASASGPPSPPAAAPGAAPTETPPAPTAQARAEGPAAAPAPAGQASGRKRKRRRRHRRGGGRRPPGEASG